MSNLDELWPRVRQVNRAIKTHYAALLYSPVYERIGRFGPDKYGQVWFIDPRTGLKLHPFGPGPWIGFTGNQEARDLVAKLALYVRDRACWRGFERAGRRGGSGVIWLLAIALVVAAVLKSAADDFEDEHH